MNLRLKLGEVIEKERLSSDDVIINKYKTL